MPKGKQGFMIRISGFMIIIRWGTYILFIIKSETDKLKAHSLTNIRSTVVDIYVLGACNTSRQSFWITYPTIRLSFYREGRFSKWLTNRYKDILRWMINQHGECTNLPRSLRFERNSDSVWHPCTMGYDLDRIHLIYFSKKCYLENG